MARTHLKGQPYTTTLDVAASSQHIALVPWSLSCPQTLPPLVPSPQVRTTYLQYHPMQMLLRQAPTQPSDYFRLFELKNTNQSNG